VGDCGVIPGHERSESLKLLEEWPNSISVFHPKASEFVVRVGVTTPTSEHIQEFPDERGKVSMPGKLFDTARFVEKLSRLPL
jgi:hypothetical protein